MSNRTEFNELLKRFENTYAVAQQSHREYVNDKCGLFMKGFPQMMSMAVEKYGRDKYSLVTPEIQIETPGCYASISEHLKSLGLKSKRHHHEYRQDEILNYGKVSIDMINREFRFW